MVLSQTSHYQRMLLKLLVELQLVLWISSIWQQMIARLSWEHILRKSYKSLIMNFLTVWLPCQMIKQSEFGTLTDCNKHTSFLIHQMILVFVFQVIQMACSSLQGLSQELFELLILKMFLLLKKSSTIAIRFFMSNTAMMEDSLQFWKINLTCFTHLFTPINQ